MFVGLRGSTSILRYESRPSFEARRGPGSPSSRLFQTSYGPFYGRGGGTQPSIRGAKSACLRVVARFVYDQSLDCGVPRRPGKRLPDYALLRFLAGVERKRACGENPVFLSSRRSLHPPMGGGVEALFRVSTRRLIRRTWK